MIRRVNLSGLEDLPFLERGNVVLFTHYSGFPPIDAVVHKNENERIELLTQDRFTSTLVKRYSVKHNDFLFRKSKKIFCRKLKILLICILLKSLK